MQRAVQHKTTPPLQRTDTLQRQEEQNEATQFDSLHSEPVPLAQIIGQRPPAPTPPSVQQAIHGIAQMFAQPHPIDGLWDSPQPDHWNPFESEAAPVQRANETASHANQTGLPDTLKTGIENLSGLAMDDVRVHYNSSQPAQLQALAYTQGSNIYVAPGQERHLPHEAWHVVQQKQGRVKSTMQMKGVGINDDQGLEDEADVMGVRAMQFRSKFVPSQYGINDQVAKTNAIVQRRSVKILSTKSDRPKTVMSALSELGVPASDLGVDTCVGWKYARPHKIEAIVHPDDNINDDIGTATRTSTKKIGGLGKIESMVLGYEPAGDYKFAGGHLIASQFWKAGEKSLTEENLVPMRNGLNSSLYKIMENEVGSYLNKSKAKLFLTVECTYNGKQSEELGKGKIIPYLTKRGINAVGLELGEKKVSFDPHVPYQIKVTVQTYIGQKDLPKATFDKFDATNYGRAMTYNKPGYKDGVGWDATDADESLPSTQIPKSRLPHNIIRLQQAPGRTYNFYQQARPNENGPEEENESLEQNESLEEENESLEQNESLEEENESLEQNESLEGENESLEQNESLEEENESLEQNERLVRKTIKKRNRVLVLGSGLEKLRRLKRLLGSI